MLIAPSEPEQLKALGLSSIAPERKGVDILFASKHHGMVGIQRKQFPGDFLKSKSDARLPKEYIQMQTLDVAILLIEGRGRWTTDGELIYEYGSWNKSSHRRYLLSVRAKGIWVEQVDSIAETIAFIGDVKAWADKPVHHSTRMVPAAKKDGWGRITSRDYLIHLIQALPDVGPELAIRIVDMFGCPFRLTVTKEQLMTVHGIGKGKAQQIIDVFQEVAA